MEPAASGSTGSLSSATICGFSGGLKKYIATVMLTRITNAAAMIKGALLEDEESFGYCGALRLANASDLAGRWDSLPSR